MWHYGDMEVATSMCGPLCVCGPSPPDDRACNQACAWLFVTSGFRTATENVALHVLFAQAIYIGTLTIRVPFFHQQQQQRLQCRIPARFQFIAAWEAARRPQLTSSLRWHVSTELAAHEWSWHSDWGNWKLSILHEGLWWRCLYT
jgi:hypothetical protein